MAFKVALLLAVVALAGAAPYDDDEQTEILDEVALCMKNLPKLGNIGDFTAQIQDVCGDKAFFQLWEGGDKMDLIPTVVDCVKGYSEVSASQVADVQQCLVKSLSAPLSLAAGYTPEQKQEIVNRLDKCLSPVPKVPRGRKPKDVCIAFAMLGLDDGISLEDLQSQTIRCLQNPSFGVSAEVMATAQECLSKELSA